jgi:hypothetical protein
MFQAGRACAFGYALNEAKRSKNKKTAEQREGRGCSGRSCGFFDHPLPPVIRVIRAGLRSSVPIELEGSVNEA